jgi:hypothetical protein
VVGAVTDALHSASMVWLERADRTYRRAARISAVVAGGNALANLLVLRSRR